MKIKFAYGIAPGTVSAGQITEGRDKIRTACENDVAVIFLAGPAAGIAAELTAERFDELYASESGFIKETLSDNKSGGAMLFAAVKGDRYLAGHMGGGLIARLDEDCTVLSKPGDRDDLRIYRGEVKETFGFMLMSEGACRSLYESSTGNLSPACGTFFQWLKEHDEETVSEALEDNINKYFKKAVKGDISVGIMVSDGADPETAMIPETAESAAEAELSETADPELRSPETADSEAELPEAARPVELTETTEPKGMPSAGSRKSSALGKYLVALLVVLAVIFVFVMKPDVIEPKDTAKQDTKPPVTTSEKNSLPEADPTADSQSNEPSVTFFGETPESYDAGVYQVGEDIPAGEYFFWTGEMLKPDSIKVNDVTCLSGELYCMTVTVGEGDTLVTDVRFTEAENVEPVKAANGKLISGKYKIGKDIVPGTYQISPMDQNAEGKYYSILDGEISNDEIFAGGTTVEVPEAGYVVFYNGVLEVVEN